MRVWARHKFQSSETPESPPKECGAAAPQAATQVTMDSAAKRKVLPWPLSIDNELIGTLDRIGITIAGNVPHDDLVAGADLLATKCDILHRRTSHVDYGHRITNDLLHQTVYQRMILSTLPIFVGVPCKRQQTSGHRVACRVVAPIISITRVPMNPLGCMSCVAAPCASMWR